MASRLSTEEENVSSTRDNFLGGDLHGNHGMCCFLVSLSVDNSKFYFKYCKIWFEQCQNEPFNLS